MVLRADGTVTTNSGMHSFHKSYVVYWEIYVVPIGHGFSFLVMENQCWKRGGTLCIMLYRVEREPG